MGLFAIKANCHPSFIGVNISIRSIAIMAWMIILHIPCNLRTALYSFDCLPWAQGNAYTCPPVLRFERPSLWPYLTKICIIYIIHRKNAVNSQQHGGRYG